MMKEKDYKEFFEMLNNTSAEQYLRATAFSRDDGVDFGGAVTEKLFFDEFYFDTENARLLKKRILKNINDSAVRLNILIGYSGCGKTTFIHYLFRERKNTKYIFDFETGIDNLLDDPIITKIRNDIEDIVIKDILDNKGILVKLYKSFYYNDYNIHELVIKYIDLNHSILKFLKAYFEDGIFDHVLYAINEGIEKGKIDLKQLVHSYFEKMLPLQILGFYLLWDLAEKLLECNKNRNIGNAFCFDNLDNIDSMDKIKKFVKYTTEAWINITTFLKLINLEEYNISNYQLSTGYSILLAIRETSYAKLTEHFNENSKRIIEEFPVSEIYSKKHIISKRMRFLNKYSSKIPKELFLNVKRIDLLMYNPYLERNVFSLFNNSYNTAITTSVWIANNNKYLIKEYEEISSLKDKRYYKGANGIILRLFFDYFKDKGYFDDKFLHLLNIGKYASEKYLFSPSRLILTYLSNSEQEVCLYDIFTYFKDILDESDIVTIIDNIYMLRFSDWRHLLTFNKLPPKDDNGLQWQLDLYNSGKSIIECRNEYSKLEITCAGRMYLNTMSTNFEFFASRLYKNEYKPLFSKDNLRKIGGKYRFDLQIGGVLKAVTNCCNRLNVANSKICELKGWGKKDFLESDLVYEKLQKDIDTQTFYNVKQFHAERIIFSHIGYINIYRQFLIRKCKEKEFKGNIEPYRKKNQILVDYIMNYLMLYKNVLKYKSDVNIEVAENLIKQVEVIKKSNYTDFSTRIETEKYQKQFQN